MDRNQIVAFGRKCTSSDLLFGVCKYQNGNAYEDDPWLLAFQVLQIPCLLVFLTTINNFLNVGLLEYIRLAIMMRDLGAMIDTKFDYKPPPSLLLRKPPPRLDLYKYPSNILSWCATWLIMDDFGRLFNNRLQVSMCASQVDDAVCMNLLYLSDYTAQSQEEEKGGTQVPRWKSSCSGGAQ